jgi:hypothetical protein
MGLGIRVGVGVVATDCATSSFIKIITRASAGNLSVLEALECFLFFSSGCPSSGAVTPSRNVRLWLTYCPMEGLRSVYLASILCSW